MRPVIVGAGAAGIACARSLVAAGVTPLVLDKGRGPGGRMATRRADPGQFDHGAPMLHPRTGEGRAWLEEAVAEGRAAPWPAGAEDGAVPYVGTPRMRDLCAGLTGGLDVRQGCEVGEIGRDRTGWALRAGEKRLVADAVVVTAPAPQAASLLSEADPALAARLSGVAFSPCYALMVAFDEPAGWPEVMRPQGAFDLVLRDSSKPGRDGTTECWVAHAGADWSRANLEMDRAEATTALLEALTDCAGPLPPLRYASAHRWRFARPISPLGEAFAASADGTLLAGGDWALGRDVEDAVSSGRAMARALLGQRV